MILNLWSGLMMLIMKLLRFEALQELLHSSMVCKNHGVELRSHTETIRSSNLPHQWDVLSFFCGMYSGGQVGSARIRPRS